MGRRSKAARSRPPRTETALLQHALTEPHVSPVQDHLAGKGACGIISLSRRILARKIAKVLRARNSRKGVLGKRRRGSISPSALDAASELPRGPWPASPFGFVGSFAEGPSLLRPRRPTN